jgi:hypothetical protein
MVAITRIRHRSRTLLAILILGLVPLSASGLRPKPIAEPLGPDATVWNGKYVCSQGVTGVTLTIARRDALHAVARFDFGAVRENPDVPSGSYMMRGYVDDTDGRLEVALFPDHWIRQPEHYAMTSLSVSGDATGKRLFGRITGRSGQCTWIDLKRVDVD